MILGTVTSQLKWDGQVLYSAAEENGWACTAPNDDIVDLPYVIVADDPPWRVELDRLHNAAEQLGEGAG